MTEDSLAHEPADRHIRSQGLALHYLDWGNATAPTLVLLHGTRDHARSWDWTARALRDDWHVVALDLRGHGDSDWSADGAYLFPYHLLDLAELAEALGPAPMSIVAHSFGGNVAARYAGLFPGTVRRLVLVDSLGPTPDNYAQSDLVGPVSRTRDWIAQRRDPRPLQPRRFATIADAAARMAKANPRLSPEQVDHLTRHGVRRHEDGYSWKFDPRVSMFTPEDFAVRGHFYWREIAAPTLILSGGESEASDPAEDGRAAAFRDARTVRFQRSGHWLHHDEFDDFAAALRDFL